MARRNNIAIITTGGEADAGTPDGGLAGEPCDVDIGVDISGEEALVEQELTERTEAQQVKDYRHLPIGYLIDTYGWEEARTIFENYIVIYLSEYRVANGLNHIMYLKEHGVVDRDFNHLIYTNEYGEPIGLRPLTMDENLRAAGRSHAADKAYHGGHLRHMGSDGSAAWERAWRYGFAGGATEVGGVSSGRSLTPAGAVHAWLNSPHGHRNAVLHPHFVFAGPGIAYATREDGRIVRIYFPMKLASDRHLQ